MAKPSSKLLFSTLFFASLALSLTDVPCQYQCYSPPTGTTPPSGVFSYPPPPGGVYPTPSGYYPNNNPPPSYGGYYSGQPPPDPILPYFPFYYKKPLHGSPDDQLSSSSPSSTPIGRSAQFLFVLFFLCFFN